MSKPVVYEHFGGKEGVYAVVVDREIQALTRALSAPLEEGGHPKALVERTTLALLGYIETSEDGFRILVRDSPVAQATGHVLEPDRRRGHPGRAPAGGPVQEAGAGPEDRPDVRADARRHGRPDRAVVAGRSRPSKNEVAAHLVNLAWNGLSGLERRPELTRPSVDVE